MKSTKFKYLSLLILALTILSLQSTLAQDVETHQKNSVYANYGSVIFSSQVSVSYERLFLKKGKYETRAKLNYGNYLSNNLDFETNAKVYEDYFSVSAVQLIGLLELNAGMALSNFKRAEGFEPDPDVDYTILMNQVIFYGNIGIRYSKNNFLIKAGVGNLELLHIGIGLNFW